MESLRRFTHSKMAAVTLVLLGCFSLGFSAPATTTLSTIESVDRGRYLLDTASLDLNKDGCISGTAELESFIAHVTSVLAGVPSNLLRAHSIVHRSDINKDGKICWCDFVAIHMQEKVTPNKHTAPFTVIPDTAMFEQLDADNDGQLQKAEKDHLENEFDSCLGTAEAKATVDAMDELVAKDGSISLAEYEQFMKGPSHKGTEAKPDSEKSLVKP
ncbi:unnamed protein product [Lymnaea stagnalis]|uniref:EF-hand domain-containing protein n=1 Tax=Lymnaea stagnalis TaxID=6523 RepID=A0AAV2I6F8_LYMST